MKTYLPEYWQWAASLTETHKKIDIVGLMEWIKNGMQKIEHTREWLESFVYQAIDEINKECLDDYLRPLEIVQKSNCIKVKNLIRVTTKKFYISDYPNETECRLDALNWIFEQLKQAKFDDVDRLLERCSEINDYDK